jgi:hypothetical protein
MEMAKASTYYATHDCVMILWFPWEKAETFMKQFEESGEWQRDKCKKHLQREGNRAGRYGAPTQMKSVSDQHMIFYKKNKADKHRIAANFVFNTAAVNAVFGDPVTHKHVNDGLRWIADSLGHYKPPTAAQRLKDDNGEVLRPCAEKSVSYMRLLIYAYTAEGDWIWDPMSATQSMTLACCITGRGCISAEMVALVFKHASRRTLTYILERIRTFQCRPDARVMVVVGGNANIYEVEAQCMIAERGLPLPQDLTPSWAKGKTLAEVMEENYSEFEVKKTRSTGKKGMQMGKGVFTKKALAVGDYVNLFAWGLLLDDQVCQQSVHPSDIHFGAPILANLVLRCSRNCPIRWLNDPRGSGKKPNAALIEMNPGDMTATRLDRSGLVNLEVPVSFGPFFPFLSFFFKVCCSLLCNFHRLLAVDSSHRCYVLCR